MASISSTSLFSSNSLSKNTSATAASIARLASGNRLAQASDDIAALAIGTALNTQVTTLRTALGNVAQAGSLLQVANGGLDRQVDILQRQKALAEQAASGGIDDSTRAALNQEFQGLSDELNRIAGGTSFNGVALLSGGASGTSLSFATGTSSSDTVNVSLADTTTATLFGGQTLDINSQATAAATSTAIDAALTAVTSAQANVGSVQSQLGSASNSLTSAIQSQEAARSAQLDTDIAEESTRLASAKVQQQASIATQAQVNKLSQGLLKLVE